MRTSAMVGLLALGVAGGCVSQHRVEKSDARVALGAAYLREGDAPGATKVLMDATKQNPRSWNAWNKLGLAYMAQGALDLSDEAFRKSIRIEATAEVRNNYGYLLMRRDDLEGAIQQFEYALTDLTYRKPAVVLSNLGHALHLAGRHEEAVIRLNDAIARAPNVCQARFNRGLAFGAMGDRQNSLDDFEVVIDMCGDKASGAYYQAAKVLVELDDRAAACTYLQLVMVDAERTDLGDAASDLHARVCL